MAHVALNLDRRIVVLPQRQHAVDIVPPQTIYDRLDRLKRPLVQDEVALQDVHWHTIRTSSTGKRGKGEREGEQKPTSADGLHARLEEDGLLDLQDATLVLLYDL